MENEVNIVEELIQSCKGDGTWSPAIETLFGPAAALEFASGLHLIPFEIETALKMMNDKKIKRLADIQDSPTIIDALPPAYRDRYDFVFLNFLMESVKKVKNELCRGKYNPNNSIFDKFAIYLIANEGKAFCVKTFISPAVAEYYNESETTSAKWALDLLGSDDIEKYLYPDEPVELDEDNPYEYDNWLRNYFLHKTAND